MPYKRDNLRGIGWVVLGMLVSIGVAWVAVWAVANAFVPSLP
jgi:hypothetical protein